MPTLAVYRLQPEESNGIALIDGPGGSYRDVSSVSDEPGHARDFTSRGDTLIVQNNRTSPPARDFSAALADSLCAASLVRHRTSAWKLDRTKLALHGGAAGGHLILARATHADPSQPDSPDVVDGKSGRTDFPILDRPWPNQPPITDFLIIRETPPALGAARHDTIAPISFDEEIGAACRQAGVPGRLLAIDRGGYSAFANMSTAAGAD